jgi:hypothetical protein
MEGNFLFDIDEVIRNVEEAEVMSLFFPAFRKSLIIDTRSNATDGPMVRLMAMANSPQDRARSIRRLRPGFPRLQNLVLIPWQRYVGSLVELGVWGRIVVRIESSGDEDAVKACEAALDELRRIERDELVAAVSGKNYQTIWSARD